MATAKSENSFSTRLGIQKVNGAHAARFQEIEDDLAIEEPLEIILAVDSSRHSLDDNAKNRNHTPANNNTFSIGITMRTPGDDKDLVTGFLFTEGIIKQYDDLKGFSFEGPATSNYGLQNKVVVQIHSDKPLDEKKFQRYFLTTSSCGICGKTAIDTLEFLDKPSLDSMQPCISKESLFKLSSIMKTHQVQFSKTGGQHAAGLFNPVGELIQIREDIGRHNAMDKLIGTSLAENFMDFNNSIVCLSGRASFELVQKTLMAGIPFLASVGAPSSLAVELAREHSMTLVGFLKDDGYNIYSGKQRLRD